VVGGARLAESLDGELAVEGLGEELTLGVRVFFFSYLKEHGSGQAFGRPNALHHVFGQCENPERLVDARRRFPKSGRELPLRKTEFHDEPLIGVSLLDRI